MATAHAFMKVKSRTGENRLITAVKKSSNPKDTKLFMAMILTNPEYFLFSKETIDKSNAFAEMSQGKRYVGTQFEKMSLLESLDLQNGTDDWATL
jgi:hypothetical protein